MFDENDNATNVDEVSSGGSLIFHYENHEENEWRPPQAYACYCEEVEQHFEALFPDRESFVMHEIISDLVHIDVHIMRPTETSHFFVVYTTGMSDMPMTPHKSIENPEEVEFAELVMFMPAEWNPGEVGQLNSDIPESEYWPIYLIKYLARFPHEYKTWFAHGHTMPNGPDYEPFTDDTQMGGVVFVSLDDNFSILETDDGKIINIYMVVPAYREEIEYKLEHGMSKLDEVFVKNELPMVIDIHRENYCD